MSSNYTINSDEIKDYTVKNAILNPKVSVIIPAYNSEKYIEKCLNSLIKQTLKDIEIIVVDDGSTDNTVNIIKQYEESDCRINLIEQEHKKQGSARNNGTNNAHGEYIGFVDSDDWVDLTYYENLYNTAKKYNSDIALADNVRTGNGKTKKRLNIKKEEFIKDFKEKLIKSKQVSNPCPTNKIYKASMLKNNNITWPEDMYCEDKLFTLKAVYYSNGIATVPNTYYYYYRNPTSTVNTKTKEHLIKTKLDKNNAKKSLVKFLREKNENVADKMFWAVEKEVKIKNFTFFKINESIKTKRIYLFGILPIFQTTIKSEN